MTLLGMSDVDIAGVVRAGASRGNAKKTECGIPHGRRLCRAGICGGQFLVQFFAKTFAVHKTVPVQWFPKNATPAGRAAFARELRQAPGGYLANGLCRNDASHRSEARFRFDGCFRRRSRAAVCCRHTRQRSPRPGVAGSRPGRPLFSQSCLFEHQRKPDCRSFRLRCVGFRRLCGSGHGCECSFSAW